MINEINFSDNYSNVFVVICGKDVNLRSRNDFQYEVRRRMKSIRRRYLSQINISHDFSFQDSCAIIAFSSQVIKQNKSLGNKYTFF